MFYKHQFAFIPANIKTDGFGFQNINTNRRLPFCNEPVQTENGAYGEVSQLVVAPRCLLDSYHHRENHEVCYG